MNIKSVVLLAFAGLAAGVYSPSASAASISCDRTVNTTCNTSAPKTCVSSILTATGTCFKLSNGIDYNISIAMNVSSGYFSADTILLDSTGAQAGNCKRTIFPPTRSSSDRCRAQSTQRSVTAMRLRILPLIH